LPLLLVTASLLVGADVAALLVAALLVSSLCDVSVVERVRRVCPLLKLARVTGCVGWTLESMRGVEGAPEVHSAVEDVWVLSDSMTKRGVKFVWSGRASLIISMV